MEHVTDRAGPLPPVPGLELATVSAEQTRLLAAAMAPGVPTRRRAAAGRGPGRGQDHLRPGLRGRPGDRRAGHQPHLHPGPPVPGGPPGAGRRPAPCLHADLYRLDHLQEIVDLGLGEMVEDGGVALVEWGDAADPVFGAGSLTVRLAIGTVRPTTEHRVITRRGRPTDWPGPNGGRPCGPTVGARGVTPVNLLAIESATDTGRGRR